MVTAPEIFRPLHLLHRDTPFVRSKETNQTPKAFSLLDSYHHYVALRKQYGPVEATQRSYYKNLLDIRSIRQEATGQPATDDVITRVVKDSQGQVIFSNWQHVDGFNLVEKYRRSGEKLTGYQKYRYELEIEQTIKVWEQATAILNQLDFSPDNSPTQTTKLLETFAFEHLQLPITVGLYSTFPELKGSSTIGALVGPAYITASSPSPLHRNGETSFMWLTRLAYLPSLNQYIVIQNGLFSGYQEPEVVFFLSYPEHKVKPLPIEEVLMTFINQLPPEFTHQHSLAIINEIVAQLGYFKPLKPIDHHIQPGEVDFDAYASSIMELLETEYQRCQQSPQLLLTLEARLAEWEKTILHSVVGGFPIDHQKLVATYVQTFSEDRVAQQPQKFKHQINHSLSFYTSRSVKLDLSLLDCVTGPKLFGADSLSTGLKVEAQAMELLKDAKKNGIKTEPELDAFCKAHHLPRKLFHKNREHKICPGCEKVPTFIGPCVCAVCHAEDNLGRLIPVPDAKPTILDSVAPTTSEFRPMRQQASITELINNDIYLWPQLPQQKAS